MDAQNLPIQVIVHCDAGGELRPLRFRYEDGQHQLHTVQIEQVTDSREVEFVGIPAILYLCKAIMDGKDSIKLLTHVLRA